MFERQRFEAALKIVQDCCTGSPIGIYQGEPELHLFDSLASTNRTLWDVIEQGARAETAVLALHQDAGRGQWGRQWVSAPGGLYLSVAVNPGLPVHDAVQLTLCTAWGIATALRDIPARLSGVEQAIPVQLKWLNDLILFERKLGGILTETRIQQEQITQAVIGVGINWKNPVPEPGINLQSFLENYPVPLIESLEMLAAIALQGLLSGYQYWQQAGIEALLPAYTELLVNLGRTVDLEGQTGEIIGVTAQGELRVHVPAPCHSTSIHQTSAEIHLKPGTISLGYGE